MPSGEANRLAPCHTRSRVCGHGEALHMGSRSTWRRGAPAAIQSRGGHPARTHLSQSWSASEAAPTTSPRDLRHFEAARNSTPSGERRTVHCGKEPADGYRHQARKSSRRSGREYRDKSILLDVTHADPQAQVHLRGGSTNHDGSVASTSEARKRQHYARPGHVSFDERSHKLSTLAVESFERLGIEGSNFID